MIKQKKITSKSGITIPKDQRLKAGLLPGMAVDLISTPNGILIRAHIPTCGICGSVKDVVGYKQVNLCAQCLDGFRIIKNKEEQDEK